MTQILDGTLQKNYIISHPYKYNMHPSTFSWNTGTRQINMVYTTFSQGSVKLYWMAQEKIWCTSYNVLLPMGYTLYPTLRLDAMSLRI